MDSGNEVWEGVRRMLPISIAGLPEAVAFGALAVSVMGHIAPIAMSLTAFSASAQFATLSVLRNGGTLAAALLAAAALNVRYLAMSATITGGSRRQRAAACLLLTDGAWGIAQGSRARLIGAGATDFVSWSGGTLIGVLAGGLLGNPTRLGLDAAFPALFVWLLRNHFGVLALVGAVVALILTPLLAPGLPIVAAGLTAGLLGARR